MSDAIRLWQHLHGDRQDLLFLWSAFYRKGADGKGELKNPSDPITFRPDQLEQAAEWVADQDHKGREVYFSVAQLLVADRHLENAAPSSVVHADMDGAPLEACPIRPTAVVESSPGRYHAYWRLARPLQPAQIASLNRRMAIATGADKAATDAVRLLRVPGTHNRKRPGAWADVEVLWIEDRTVKLEEIERVLPPMPEQFSRRHEPASALSTDNSEVLAKLSPLSRKLYSGDTSDYPDDDGLDRPNNRADWALVQELARATGGDIERTYTLMRQSGLERPKWDERRNGSDLLMYTIERAIASPSEAQNATPYRSDNGCGGHCPHREREQALLHQAQLVTKVLQLNLSAEIKVMLLWMMVLVGVNAGQKFSASADSMGKKLHLAPQTVRGFFHGVCRYDLTKKHKVSPEVDPTSALNNARGLFDLDSTRAPELGAYVRMFTFTPLTGTGYGDFLEAAIERAPELLPAPAKRTRRKPEEEVSPPWPVAMIPTHAQGHGMHSDQVSCAECGEDFARETRYTPIVRQNVMPQRSEDPPPTVGTFSDVPQRFEPASKDLEKLLRLYDRAAAG